MDALQQVLHRQVYLYDVNDRLGIFTPKTKGYNGLSTTNDSQDMSDSQIDSSMGITTPRDQTTTFRSSIPDAEHNYFSVDKTKEYKEEGKAHEVQQNSMSMFIDDPIIANLPK